MKRFKIPIAMAAMALVLILTSGAALGQSQVSQTFTLRPGWNAVFLEVDPEPRDPATVFSGIQDLDSVWAWLSRESTTEFIQNPGEGLWGQPGWHVYFNSTADEFRSKLTNLYAIFGGWAYLIKIKPNTPEQTWEVKGPPSVRKIRWLADSFNLVGFQLDPADTPTFEDFFAPSRAHAGQAVYRLNNGSGKWEFVQDPANAKIESGGAYWIYCEGSSSYQGPLKVVLPMSAGLHFGAGLIRQTVTLSNLSDVTRTVTVTPSPSSDVVLFYREWDAASGYFTWQDIGQMPPIALEPDRPRNVVIEIRREQMSPGLSESFLEFTDDKGIRIRVPVSAERIQ
jgi:hypothetical protein